MIVRTVNELQVATQGSIYALTNNLLHLIRQSVRVIEIVIESGINLQFKRAQSTHLSLHHFIYHRMKNAVILCRQHEHRVSESTMYLAGWVECNGGGRPDI